MVPLRASRIKTQHMAKAPALLRVKLPRLGTRYPFSSYLHRPKLTKALLPGKLTMFSATYVVVFLGILVYFGLAV